MPISSLAVLIAANAYVYRPSRTQRTAEAPVAQPSSADADADLSAAIPKPRSEALARAIRQPPFEWAPIESADYFEYMANLRQLGFPDELVREIIIADLNDLYAPREAALTPTPVPQDAPLSQRRRKPTPADIEQMIQLREIQIEKHAVLQELLGVWVPREMIRTPNSRNWEAYEYAIRLLPPEKQEAAQLIQEDLWINDDWNQAQGPDHLARDETELAAYRRVAEERDAALNAILTPEEFELYERTCTPTGSELTRRVLGMDATDAELQIMYKLTDEYWRKTGAVHGRWRAITVPPEQIAAAEEELNIALQQALGPDRYVDYQMATSDTGQKMNSLALRYQVPRETIREAFAIQTQLDQLAAPGNPTHPLADPLRQPRWIELDQQLRDTLGIGIWQAWMDGRDQRYNLSP